jgi:hypothetical protein
VFVTTADILVWMIWRSAARTGSVPWANNKAQSNQARVAAPGIGTRTVALATNDSLFMDFFLI